MKTKDNSMYRAGVALVIGVIITSYCFIAMDNKFGALLLAGVLLTIEWYVMEYFNDVEQSAIKVERESKMTDEELVNQALGQINPKLVCVHCQSKGCVRRMNWGFGKPVSSCDNCGVSDNPNPDPRKWIR